MNFFEKEADNLSSTKKHRWPVSFLLNQKNNFYAALQAYHAMAGGLALFYYFNDNEARNSEEGVAMAVHFLNYIALSQRGSSLVAHTSALLSYSGNIFRLGGLYLALESGVSHFSFLTNILESASTILSAGAELASLDDEEERLARIHEPKIA